jgi:hypothetical protein
LEKKTVMLQRHGRFAVESGRGRREKMKLLKKEPELMLSGSITKDTYENPG